MRKSIVTMVVLVFLLILSACNKIKKQSKRLSKKETWSVEVYVDDQLEYAHSWTIQSCDDPYDELCEGIWIDGTEDVSFYWQFQDKSEQFELQKIDEQGDLNAGEVMLHNLVYQLSGNYSVEEAEKENYIFQARQINGFEDQTVRLELK